MNWGPFGEKKLKRFTMPKKNWKGGPLGFSNIYSVAKLQKMKGDPLGIFFEKSLTMPKKTERWKTFLVQFPGPTGTIWGLPLNFVELFWSLHVYRKKTLTKSHDYSRLFLKKSAD